MEQVRTRTDTDVAEPGLAGRHVHFVGIGGAGMAGLAQLVHQHGAGCTGSDQCESANVTALRRDGVAVQLEQAAATVPPEAELVVISAAITEQHPEVVEARRRGLEVVKYAAMLGRLMRGRCGVAVAGTHGKSTTTSMLCHALIQAGLDPSFIVGAQCRQIGGGSRCGGLEHAAAQAATRNGHPKPTQPAEPGPILVTEACEYDRSFHNLAPRHGLILNVEADHLDVYGSLDEIVASFAGFARLLPAADAGGSLLIHHTLPQRMAITAGLACAVETIGFSPEADWQVTLEPATGGGARTSLAYRGEPVAAWSSPLPGEHMAYNAAAAAITAHRLGAGWDVIGEALASFEGLDRRMQYLGSKGPGDQASEGEGQPADSADGGAVPRRLRHAIPVIDDYGHHPTEIDTTLRALRGHWHPDRLICVFQPHQHSRTRFLMQEFATSFSQADIVITADIYFVRDSEQERQAVTAGDLVDALRQQAVRAMHIHPLEAIVEQLHVLAQPGDLIVTMGAGDIWRVAHDFLADRA